MGKLETGALAVGSLMALKLYKDKKDNQKAKNAQQWSQNGYQGQFQQPPYPVGNPRQRKAASSGQQNPIQFELPDQVKLRKKIMKRADKNQNLDSHDLDKLFHTLTKGGLVDNHNFCKVIVGKYGTNGRLHVDQAEVLIANLIEHINRFFAIDIDKSGTVDLYELLEQYRQSGIFIEYETVAAFFNARQTSSIKLG
ncbi:MAG: hypothetical protein MHMPM18_004858, partial [Marteilia pararefringens]